MYKNNLKQVQTGNKTTFIFLGMVGIVILVFISALTISVKNSPKDKVSGNTSQNSNNDDFLGEKGQKVEAEGDKIYIDENLIKDGNYHAFNYYSPKAGKNIYFFTVKASDGTYRVAANDCEVCYGAKKGFKQAGDRIQCNNCGNTYTKDQIALEKGGCNPGPIDKNASVENGKLAVRISDIENVAYLF